MVLPIVDPIFGMARLNKMDGLYHQPVDQFPFVPVFKLRLLREVKFHIRCRTMLLEPEHEFMLRDHDSCSSSYKVFVKI